MTKSDETTATSLNAKTLKSFESTLPIPTYPREGVKQGIVHLEKSSFHEASPSSLWARTPALISSACLSTHGSSGETLLILAMETRASSCLSHSIRYLGDSGTNNIPMMIIKAHKKQSPRGTLHCAVLSYFLVP
ncbi:hypothetical protein WN66_05632 [Saccharomyces cerevisiae]|nr:hypothetical protein WN66_05632 [Saccharomyces cerevisiae]